jgi:dihydrofolate reductase
VRTITISNFITLDGVVQAPGGPEEDPSGGFEHGGWSVSYWDDVIGEHLGSQMAQQHDLLLGRGTYEIFAAHWPYVTDDPYADKLNAATKYVASTTLSELSWAHSHLLGDDVPAAVAELKRTDGPDLEVAGSPGLAQTLLAHDLVDTVSLIVYPVVVGAGKRLFGDGTKPGAFELAESISTPSGVVIASYQRAGAIPSGSFAFEEPTDEEVARRERIAAE